MKELSLLIPIFRSHLFFCFSEKQLKNRRPNISINDKFAGKCIIFTDSTAIITVKYPFDIATVVHEILHFTNNLFRYKNIPLVIETEEIHCELVSFILEKYIDHVQNKGE